MSFSVNKWSAKNKVINKKNRCIKRIKTFKLSVHSFHYTNQHQMQTTINCIVVDKLGSSIKLRAL